VEETTMPDGTAGRRGRNAVQDIDRQVGARIRERRITLGLTARQLAERIGTSEQHARNYENGQHCVTAGRLYLIAQALDLEPGHFFEDLGPERPTGPRRPMPLELARHFVDLPSRRHQEALAELARALTER
jgi:transcriptional regulator with XRE-family HTH domain